MRKFSIVNFKNEIQPLNNELPGSSGSTRESEVRIMLVNPSGLGFTMERNYNELGDGVHKSSKDSQQQGSFQCDLYFTGDNPYGDYQKFIDWLLPSEKFMVAYSPYDGSVFRCEMQVEFITKTELDRTGALICPCSFYCLTEWFKPTDYDFSIDPGIPENAARFGLVRFDDDESSTPARFTSASNAAYSAIINPQGHSPASLKFRFEGSVTNPTLSLVGRNTGTVYGECHVEVTINDGEIFEYSSDRSDSYIRRIVGNQTINLEDLVTPGSLAYFLIPISEPCDLFFRGDSDPDGSMTGQVRHYYRSV